MSYSIYITRESPILLEEWKSVVASRTDVRLQVQAASAQNPKTGEVITVPLGVGDAEVLVGDRWHPCFRWSEGEIRFGAPPHFEDRRNPLRQVVRELAQQLGATVVGEEEEPYE